jgi:hypothetical protein
LLVAHDPAQWEKREADLESVRCGLCKPAWQIASSTV